MENGLDYLVSAAESATRNNSRDWKYAILNLANGMELLLKARLEREDWTLLFADPQKANRPSLKKGDFVSANFKQTCDRLAKEAKVAIEVADRRNLDALRKLRNQFTHYSVAIESTAVKSLVAKSMNFSIEFCQREGLVVNAAQLEEMHRLLNGFQGFVDERNKTIAAELEGFFTWHCPTCLQSAIVLDDDYTNCRFCSVVPNPEELAEHNNLERSSSDPSDPRLDLPNCPECWEGLVTHLVSQSESGTFYMCSYCGDSGDYIVNCVRCGLITRLTEDANPEIDFCDNCIEHIRRE